jgi:predicted transcriptional regulator
MQYGLSNFTCPREKILPLACITCSIIGENAFIIVIEGEIRMFGLFGGKPRSKLGKFLDKRGISQEWLVKESKVSRNTISELASGKREPTVGTIKKIMAAIKKVDPNVRADDFFDL